MRTPDGQSGREADGERPPQATADFLQQLRVVAFLEGLSFVLLLFVAMPLKYYAGLPLAVRVVGSVHGLLFLAFCWALVRAAIAREWPLRRSLVAFVASLLPFGTFVFDRSLKREMAGAAPS